MDASLVQLITGFTAILSAALGLFLIIREIKGKQRKEIRRLDDAVNDTWNELVEYHTYSAQLRIMLADQGLKVPDPPKRRITIENSDEPT